VYISAAELEPEPEPINLCMDPEPEPKHDASPAPGSGFDGCEKMTLFKQFFTVLSCSTFQLLKSY
jgi:hypothetical protein